MALFQPTNITPSTFAGIGGGTIDVNNPVSISWQVNGNSPMIGFSITFYSNDDSSLAGTTGNISLQNPFYGTDEKGNPVVYTYEPENTKWSNWTLTTVSGYSLLSFTNGNEYKMQITQYWGHEVGENVVQYSESVFITRSAPTLSIDPFGTISDNTVTIDSITQTFTATYSQEQGDTINWVEWTIIDNHTNKTVLDTGEIYTQILSTSYNAFETGKQNSPHTYTVICTIETENGVQATDSKVFNVLYANPNEGATLNVECGGDGSAIITYDTPLSINGIPSFPESEVADHIIDGKLVLGTNEDVFWEQTSNGNLSFDPPYTFEILQDIEPPQTEFVGNFASDGIANVIDRDNQGYIVVGSSTGARIFKEQPNGVPIQVGEPLVTQAVTGAKFFLYNNVPALVIIGNFGTSIAKLYLYSDSEESYKVGQDIVSSNITGTPQCLDIIYLQENDSTYMFIGGQFTQNSTSIYGLYFVFERYYFSHIGSFSNLDGVVNTACFGQKDGNAFLIIGGTFTERAFIYTVLAQSTVPNTRQQIYADSNTTTLRDQVTAVQISTLETGFLLGGYLSSFSNGTNLRFYTVSYVQGYFQANFVENVDISIFQQNGALSIENIEFDPYVASRVCVTAQYVMNAESPAVLYMFDGNHFEYVTGLFDANGDPIVARSINTAKFSDDGKTLYIGGTITNNCAMIELYNGENSGNVLLYNYNTDVILRMGNSWYGLYVNIFNGVTTISYYVYNSTNSNQIKFALPQSITDSNGTGIYVYWYKNGSYVSNSNQSTVSFPMNNLSSITISGTSTTSYIFITNETGYVPSTTSTSQPTRDDNTLFLTNFPGGAGLEAGISSSSVLYRNDGNSLLSLSIDANKSSQMKDFGIKSGESYTYKMVYISNNQYTVQNESEPICQSFHSIYLMEATPDTTYENVFHVQKVWRFGNNMEFGTVSNGNNPSWLNNFTQYRYRQPATTSGKSGTLQALLSNTVNGQYNDTAQMMDELFAASLTTNPLFLKDMKGNLYMVSISAPITQTVDTQNGVQQVTVSIPWEEIGSTDGIALIQLPTDEGWEQTV